MGFFINPSFGCGCFSATDNTDSEGLLDFFLRSVNGQKNPASSGYTNADQSVGDGFLKVFKLAYFGGDAYDRV